MINLSYGHISKKFIDFKSITKILYKILSDVDYSNYVTPGGYPALRKIIAKNYTYNLTEDSCCTSISTNLSVFICYELFSKTKRVVLFTPIFLNYYKQLMFTNSFSPLFYDYELFLSGSLNYDDLKAGDVCILVIPSNPSGQVPSYEILEENLKKIKEKGVMSIIDASWVHSVYNKEKELDIKKLSNLTMKYDAILLLGFTKILGITSIRCSGVVASAERIKLFIDRHDQLAISCGAIDELLSLELIKSKPILDWNKLNCYLKSQNEKAIKILNDSGLNIKFLDAEAGIFLYFYVIGLKNADQVVFVCKNKGVLVYPSNSFESRNDGFRICISGEEEDLRNGLSVLVDSIKEEMR
jgi:aspartate/methionine/tyrosine aminotransferase